LPVLYRRDVRRAARALAAARVAGAAININPTGVFWKSRAFDFPGVV
jgi:hypothetical protein